MPSRKRPSKRKSKRQGVSRKKCKTCSRNRKVGRRRSSTNLRGGAGVNVDQYIKLFKYTGEHSMVLVDLKNFSIPDTEDEETEQPEDEDNYGYIIQKIVNYYNISKLNAEYPYIFAKGTVGLCKALNKYVLCYNQSKINNLIKKINVIASKGDSMSITDYFNLIQGYKRINKILRNTTAANFTQEENTFDEAQHLISEMYSQLAIKDKIIESEKTRIQFFLHENEEKLQTCNFEIEYRKQNNDTIQNTLYAQYPTVNLLQMAQELQNQIGILRAALLQNESQRDDLVRENEHKRNECKNLMGTFAKQRQVVEATVRGYQQHVICPDKHINLKQMTVNISETTIAVKIVNVFEQVMRIYNI